MALVSWDHTRDGEPTEAALRGKLEALGYSVSRYVYPPGTYFPEHTHDVDKIDAVISGRFRITLEGEARRPRHDEATMETDVPGVYVAGTGTGGTQMGGARIFIENCHVHVERIVAHLEGRRIDLAAPVYSRPES